MSEAPQEQKIRETGPEVKTYRDLAKKVRELVRYGDDAMEKKNYGYAITMYRKVLVREPMVHEVREKLHDAQQKKVDNRVSMVNNLIAATAAIFLKLKMKGLANKGEYAKAIDVGEECMSIDPTSIASCKLLAEAAEEAGMLDIAQMALEIGQKYHPKSVGLLSYLGFIYGQNDKGKLCLSTYQKLAALQPNNTKWQDEVRKAASLAAMEDGRMMELEKGEGDFRTMLKDEDEAALLEQQGRTHATKEGRQKLIASQLELLETNDNVEARKKLAELYAQDEQYDQARDWYIKSQEIAKVEDPTIDKYIADMTTRMLQKSLAEWQAYLNEEDRSEEELQEAQQNINQIEQDLTAHLLETLETRVRKNPNSHEDRYELGQLLAKMGRPDDALPHFQKVQANPRFKVDACMHIGSCFVDKGVYDLAIDQFKVVVKERKKMDGMRKEALYQLGKSYQNTGDAEKAKECFKEIYQADVSFKDIREIIENG